MYVQVELFFYDVGIWRFPWGDEIHLRRYWWDGYFEVLEYCLI